MDPAGSGEDRKRVRHRTVGVPERTIKLARQLRKEMSLPEVLLWRELRGKPSGVKFRRQFGVLEYVADFACVEARLLVEIDGIAHDMGERPERDRRRDALLIRKGWRVVRIPATRVLLDVSETAAAIVAMAHSLNSKNPPRNGEVAAAPAADGGAETSPGARR